MSSDPQPQNPPAPASLEDVAPPPTLPVDAAEPDPLQALRQDPRQDPRQEKTRKRVAMYLALVAAAFVIVPFLFWRGAWFGRALPDAELEQYLNDKDQPRHIQHALVQIGERIERGDKSVEQWYPTVVLLTDSPMQELRVTLAWVLGTDQKSEAFHKALLHMLQDRDLLVRRNVALSLVRFQDAAGRDEILAMFRPTVVRSPAAGTVRYRAKMESRVDNGTAVARIELGPNGQGPDGQGQNKLVDARTPVPGTVLEIKIPDGSTVSEGDELMVLSPGEMHLWEALRALVIIGQPEDLELLTQFERFGSAGLPEKYRQQAQSAANEIRRRSESISK